MVFVYRAGHSALGSIDIRVRHLGSALKIVSSPDSSVRAITEEALASNPPVDSDVILSKTVLSGSNRALVERLGSAGNRIWSDFVDGSETDLFESQLTGYLCSSKSEYQYRFDRGLSAHYLPQQVDARWPDQSFEKDEFRTIYVGGTGGCKYLDRLPEIEKFFVNSLENRSVFARTVGSVASASHHFSVRAFPGEGVFKPETKAMVAARLGSVFIGSREDIETSLVLSADYPYLAADSSEEAVREVLDFAHQSFQGDPWERATVEMDELKTTVCDIGVGISLLDWFRRDHDVP